MITNHYEPNKTNMLTAPKGKTFDPVPKGNHVARLYQIVHIGTIPDSYLGEQKQVDKVRLTFELCNERKVFKEGDEPKPFSISREFTLSMSEKANLRKIVEGMTGVALHEDEAYSFDIEQLLGEACLLNVIHKDNAKGTTMSLIQSASPLPKGMTAPDIFNEAKSIDVNTATIEEIDAMPEFLRDKIKSSDEYDKRFRQSEKKDAINPEDVPF